jgi:hypothetical protein
MANLGFHDLLNNAARCDCLLDKRRLEKAMPTRANGQRAKCVTGANWDSNMRFVAMITVLAVAAPAAAQTPSKALSPAPTPDATLTVPAPERTPGKGRPRSEPMVHQEAVAPPGSAALNAGPTNATPFSSTPAGTLPSESGTPQGRSEWGTGAQTTPNLGR